MIPSRLLYPRGPRVHVSGGKGMSRHASTLDPVALDAVLVLQCRAVSFCSSPRSLRIRVDDRSPTIFGKSPTDPGEWWMAGERSVSDSE
jgi:hypothetical protein